MVSTEISKIKNHSRPTSDRPSLFQTLHQHLITIYLFSKIYGNKKNAGICIVKMIMHPIVNSILTVKFIIVVTLILILIETQIYLREVKCDLFEQLQLLMQA